MATRIIMVVCTLFVPALVLLFGVWLRRRPPEINGLFGYRTKRSMRSRQTWDFAQMYLGKLWIPIGTAMLVLSAVAAVVFWRREIGTFGKVVEALTYAQIAVLLLTIPITEHALKKKFDHHA